MEVCVSLFLPWDYKLSGKCKGNEIFCFTGWNMILVKLGSLDNNQVKIQLNRYQTQAKISELVELQLYDQARYMQLFLADDIYKSDVNMSNEE